jgi:hypothetical protein
MEHCDDLKPSMGKLLVIEAAKLSKKGRLRGSIICPVGITM